MAEAFPPLGEEAPWVLNSDKPFLGFRVFFLDGGNKI